MLSFSVQLIVLILPWPLFSPLCTGQETSSSSCREELNDFHFCLKNALYEIRSNDTSVEIGVKECFQQNGCNMPDIYAFNVTISPTEAGELNRRLKQSGFINVDWSTFEQCRVTVNTEARDLIRACVKRQVADFDPDVDEDIDEDGEVDGQVTNRRTKLGSYAISKLADDSSVCGEHVDKTNVKQCIFQAFVNNQHSKVGSSSGYCDSLALCKERLSAPCVAQLKQTHSLLCQCAVDEIISSKGDHLRERFLTCAKVEADQRQTIQTDHANPHREYANCFCHTRLNSCSWLWRELVEESTSDTVRSKKEEFIEDTSFFNNETSGPLGAVLKAFSKTEVARLRKSLRDVSWPNKASNNWPSITEETKTIVDIIGFNQTALLKEALFRFVRAVDNDTIHDGMAGLLARLFGNNSEIDRLAQINADFFGYIRDDANGTNPGDLRQLAAALEHSQAVEHLVTALHHFMNPYGNGTNATATDDERIEPLLSRLRDADEESRLIGFVHKFMNHQSSVIPAGWNEPVYNILNHNTSNV